MGVGHLARCRHVRIVQMTQVESCGNRAAFPVGAGDQAVRVISLVALDEIQNFDRIGKAHGATRHVAPAPGLTKELRLGFVRKPGDCRTRPRPQATDLTRTQVVGRDHQQLSSIIDQRFKGATRLGIDKGDPDARFRNQVQQAWKIPMGCMMEFQSATGSLAPRVPPASNDGPAVAADCLAAGCRVGTPAAL